MKGEILIDIMCSIIICAQTKVQNQLRGMKTFDETSAADAEEVKINFKEILDLMSGNGLISRTC